MPTTYPQAALAYYSTQEDLALRVKVAVRRLWAAMSAADIDGSWAVQGPRILALVGAAQLVAAESADPYLDAVLAELGIPGDRAGTFVPEGVAGVASDGRDLQSLLTEPVIGVKTQIAQGADQNTAVASQGSRLEMLAQTMVQDAGRLAVGAALVARPHVAGWVRMLTPPSCSRCVLLAGRWYRYSAGFARHP
jgi:hypothetical protein